METVVSDFVRVLRRHNLRVSPAEGLDALRALEQVGLGERAVVKDTLRATMIKDTDDVESFDRLFDLYFSLQPEREKPQLQVDIHDHDHGKTPSRLEVREDIEGEPQPEGHNHSHEADESTDIRRFLDEDRIVPSQDIHGDPESMRLSLFSQQLILNRKQNAMQQIMQKITHQLRIQRARNIFNPGELVTSTGSGQEIPLNVSASELQGLVDHLHEMEVDEDLIRELTAQSENILRGLPELVAAMLEREKNLKREEKDDSDFRRRSLRKLLDFSATEQREMEAAIRRIARQIHGAHTRRLKQDRIGRISVPHTLRNNIRYEGIPFQPVLRRRREGRPRVALLCDVSISTRNLARFWLHLIYQMQSLFSKVRTFVFVADLAEVTQIFEERTMHGAVDEVFSGNVLDADVNSDFGRAAGQFVGEHLSSVNHRTTVVILGDGRNNGKSANVEALEEIAHHARQVIWITPEPKWGWALGGCDMPLYEPVCDRVEVVRDVQGLASVAEDLVKIRV